MNDAQVFISMNENCQHRGLHLAVINESTGVAELARCYDTHATSEALEAFIDSPLPEGRIIAAACAGDCAVALSEKVKKWFQDMGSEEITKLKMNEGFAFLGVSGRKDFQEKKAASHKDRAPIQLCRAYQARKDHSPEEQASIDHALGQEATVLEAFDEALKLGDASEAIHVDLQAARDAFAAGRAARASGVPWNAPELTPTWNLEKNLPEETFEDKFGLKLEA